MKKNKNKQIKQNIIKFLFILPALLIFIFIIGIPFFSGINISLTNWNGISDTYDYVGLKNLKTLFQDPQIILPIKNTILYTALTLIGVNVLALLIALGLTSNFKGAKFMRSVMFLPIITSLVIASFIWTYMYIDVLSLVGIPGPLGNPNYVMYGIVIICLWRDTGLAMVIYIAALQNVPSDLVEAARIDGASKLQVFKNVTLPMISPAITVCTTLWMGYGLKSFDYVKTATNGGPGRASETFALYVYNHTFTNNRTGYGQMAAIVMLIFVLGISLSTTALLRKMEVQE